MAPKLLKFPSPTGEGLGVRPAGGEANNMNKIFSLLAAIMMAATFTACTSEVDNPVKPSLDRTDIDTWDASTKTLTVNNNPGMGSYDNNSEIQHIVFAANVTFIDQNAFMECGNLESVTFAENSQLETISSCAFLRCGKLTTITIPASVTTLNGPVFRESGLQTIFFEEGSRLKTIGDYAFTDTPLTAISIPASVTHIAEGAFAKCEYLSSVTFANDSQLESIDAIAFWNCYALKKITIPASVTHIDDYAFDNCPNLSVVTILAQTPPTLGKEAFAHTAENFRIYVPGESVDAYKKAYPDLADRIKPIMGDDVTEIDSVVWDCTNVTGMDVDRYEEYEKAGIKVTCAASEVYWADYGIEDDPVGICFQVFEGGGFTFTNTLGKKFTKIEMTLSEAIGWDLAAQNDKLGPGWPTGMGGDVEIFETLKVTWTGKAEKVDLLFNDYHNVYPVVSRIVFYMTD